jgi:hypothetical protein
MITKRLLSLYQHNVQLAHCYTVYLASPFDWNPKTKRLVKTTGLSYWLYLLFFFTLGTVLFGVMLRTLSRVFLGQILDPLSTGVTIIYIIGMSIIWMMVFEFTMRNARDDLVEFANSLITLDKQFQRKQAFNYVSHFCFSILMFPQICTEVKSDVGHPIKDFFRVNSVTKNIF